MEPGKTQLALLLPLLFQRSCMNIPLLSNFILMWKTEFLSEMSRKGKTIKTSIDDETSLIVFDKQLSHMFPVRWYVGYLGENWATLPWCALGGTEKANPTCRGFYSYVKPIWHLMLSVYQPNHSKEVPQCAQIKRIILLLTIPLPSIHHGTSRDKCQRVPNGNNIYLCLH